MPGIGPALPPHLVHLGSRSSDDTDFSQAAGPSRPGNGASHGNAGDEDGDEDEEDDYGPALPPHLVAARKAGPSPATAGPSRPSALYSSPSPPRLPAARTRHVGPPSGPGPADDSDDDDIGPRPDQASSSRFDHTGSTEQEKTGAELFREREARWAREREAAAVQKKPQREEWMLLPPEKGVLANVNPLGKRPTTFSRSTANNGSSAARGGGDGGGEDEYNVWTETPAQKAQRLADELAGVTRPPPSSSRKRAHSPSGEKGDTEAKERDARIRASVEAHNRDSRGASLLEKHRSKPKEEDEGPPVIWDHEKMMGVTGRLLSDQEREGKISEAGKGLGDRFGHSKRGAYDH